MIDEADALPSHLFDKMMENLEILATIHEKVSPQTKNGEELLEELEARMLALFRALPRGQV